MSIDLKDNLSIINDNEEKLADILIKNINKMSDYEHEIVSKNSQGLKYDVKIESIVNKMIFNNVDIFSFQETWLTCNNAQTVINCTIFYHGLNSHSSHRGERRVAIVLSLQFYKFYANTGEKTPTHTAEEADNFQITGAQGQKLKHKAHSNFKEESLGRIKRRNKN